MVEKGSVLSFQSGWEEKDSVLDDRWSTNTMHCYKSLLPPADEVGGMYVMFSVRSVILFGGGEVPCDHYP